MRQFAATVQLKALADWLQQEGVQTVAMESTGLYWVALYDLLEERGLEVLLVDADSSSEYRDAARPTTGTANGSRNCTVAGC